MFNIMLSRRKFNSAIGAGLLLTSVKANAININTTEQITHTGFVSAATDKTNRHWLAILNSKGMLNHKIALPERAHQIAIRPNSSHLAVAARRPGRYLFVVDAENGDVIHELSPQHGHHFYGHSCYSSDGRYLFTTENHIDSGEGRIVVRDSGINYAVVNHFSSYGMGPHEIKLHPDGDTLVIANGGILTHPESGRAKLNLESMSPSLVYVSSQTGELLEQSKLPDDLHQLSIRHIDINQAGLTAIAMQYQGSKLDHMPLIAIHTRGQPLKALWAPEHINLRMKNYCGSVCFNQSGSIFAVTSPRGDLLTLWDAIDGEYITQFRCRDVCGVSAYGKHGFAFSNGFGKLYTFDMKSSVLKLVKQNGHHDLAWDNHLTLYA